MKNFILIFSFIFFSAGAMAQGVGAGEKQEAGVNRKAAAQAEFDAEINKKADAMTMNMQKFLNIGGQQLIKVRQINRKSVKQMEIAKRELKNDPRALYSRIGQISNSRLSLIKDVLSPQQFDKYQKKREEKMGIPQENGSGNSGGASGSGIQVPGGGYSY